MSLPPKVVQRTPDLGLTIKLQRLPEAAPEPEAPAPPPSCLPARVLNPAGEVVAELGCGEEYQYECPPAGGGGGCGCIPGNITGLVWAAPYLQLEDEWGSWLAHPSGADFADFSAPDGRHLQASVQYGEAPIVTFYGVPQGSDITGVEWEWSWSEPVLHAGEVRTMGPLLVVDIDSRSGAFDGGLEYTNTLIATATCAGAEIGQMSLRISAMMH